MSDSVNVIEASKELNRIIRESEEYQKFCLYQEELQQEPELYARTLEFRRKNFEIRIDNILDDAEQASQLAREYKDILETPLSASYLNAELGFCRMMQVITRNICDGIELGLEFME